MKFTKCYARQKMRSLGLLFSLSKVMKMENWRRTLIKIKFIIDKHRHCEALQKIPQHGGIGMPCITAWMNTTLLTRAKALFSQQTQNHF